MIAYRVEVFPHIDGQYGVRLRHANSNVILSSEGYSRRWSARRAGKKIARTFRLEYREVDS